MEEEKALKVINFSHPFTDEQKRQLKSLLDYPDSLEFVDIPTQLNHDTSFVDQIEQLIDSVDISSAEWQTTPILINPPAYAYAAVILIVVLHGRMGYFPAILRIRPIAGTTPSKFEVAEIINLQHVRDIARNQRLEE